MRAGHRANGEHNGDACLAVPRADRAHRPPAPRRVRPTGGLLAAVAVAALGLPLAGCQRPGEGEALVPLVRTVSLSDPDRPLAFEPGMLDVAGGTTVRWVNEQGGYHTVTFTDSLQERRPSGVFDGALFARGDTLDYTFQRPGVYYYYCQPHAEFMVGTIVVKE